MTYVDNNHWASPPIEGWKNMTDKDKEFVAAILEECSLQSRLSATSKSSFQSGANFGRQFTLKEASEELAQAKAEIEDLKEKVSEYRKGSMEWQSAAMQECQKVRDKDALIEEMANKAAAIKSILINHLEEPERQAFWAAHEALELYRKHKANQAESKGEG